MTVRALLISGVLMLVSACAHGEPRKIDDFHWDQVDRIVAVGDLHGDYSQYIKVLSSAGLVNTRGKWTGGATHLVQTGDIPDRGPDTRRIMEHIQGLKKQAEKKGGRVHTLIGNHEAMNSYGDLRYVTPAEFAAFAGPDSRKLQDKQFEFQLSQIRQTRPEEFLTLDLEQYRIEWEKKFPLGWVEHRFFWMPEGEYGKLVLTNPVSIMINGTVFLHGGLSPQYCRFSLADLSAQVWDKLENYDPQDTGILDDQNGPLWYRGLALEDEEAFEATVDGILEKYQARRIVVGHTPTGGVVWPRFHGKVIVNDTGLADYYGANDGYLEIIAGRIYAGYSDQKLEIPEGEEQRLEYLRAVVALKPQNEELRERLDKMSSAAPAPGQAKPSVSAPVPVESETLSAGICQ